MLYKEISTDGQYKAAIQKFWVLDNSSSCFHSSAQYALPNGCCTIAFISGNGLSLTLAGRDVELSAGVYLSGQITKRASLSLKPYTKAVMAQLKPWFPSAITKVPMSDLVDSVLNIEDINSSLFRRFTEIDLTNETAVTDAFFKALNAYIDSYKDADFIQWVFGRLQKELPGTSNIADIAIASGYTQRRVEQKFKTLVGPSVKEMQRILQIRRLIDEMQNFKSYGNLGTLALRYGYYDQSHFIKSYQRIITETPSAFDRADYILPTAGHFDFLQS